MDEALKKPGKRRVRKADGIVRCSRVVLRRGNMATNYELFGNRIWLIRPTLRSKISAKE